MIYILPLISGFGIKGEYFNNPDLNNPDFSDPVLVRSDAQIDFKWWGGSPDQRVQPEQFAVRWTGQIEALYDETYTFTTESDEGVRLWVNDQLIIDQWSPHGLTAHSGSIALAAGQKAEIRLEYFEGIHDATVRLLWESDSQVREVVPEAFLYHVPLTPEPAPDPTTDPTPEPTPDPDPTAGGTGLLGEYFDESDLLNPVLSRVDGQVDFDWGDGSPDAAVAPDQFQVIWSGQLEIPTSGDYTFYLNADENVTLWLDGELLIDTWDTADAGEQNAMVTGLVAGQRYDIAIEYYDESSDATVELAWESASRAKEVIPAAFLYEPEEPDGGDNNPTGSGSRPTILYGGGGVSLSPLYFRRRYYRGGGWGGGSPSGQPNLVKRHYALGAPNTNDDQGSGSPLGGSDSGSGGGGSGIPSNGGHHQLTELLDRTIFVASEKGDQIIQDQGLSIELYWDHAVQSSLANVVRLRDVDRVEVELEIDGALGKFTKLLTEDDLVEQWDNGSGLIQAGRYRVDQTDSGSASDVLGFLTQKNSIELKLQDYTEMFAAEGGIGNLLNDRLYGATAKVAYKLYEDGDLAHTVTQNTYFTRWVDTTTVEPDVELDNEITFDEVVEGQDGRFKTVDYFLGNAKTYIKPSDGEGAGFVAPEFLRGTGTAQLELRDETIDLRRLNVAVEDSYRIYQDGVSEEVNEQVVVGELAQRIYTFENLDDEFVAHGTPSNEAHIFRSISLPAHFNKIREEVDRWNNILRTSAKIPNKFRSNTLHWTWVAAMMMAESNPAVVPRARTFDPMQVANGCDSNGVCDRTISDIQNNPQPQSFITDFLEDPNFYRDAQGRPISLQNKVSHIIRTPIETVPDNDIDNWDHYAIPPKNRINWELSIEVGVAWLFSKAARYNAAAEIVNWLPWTGERGAIDLYNAEVRYWDKVEQAHQKLTSWIIRRYAQDAYEIMLEGLFNF